MSLENHLSSLQTRHADIEKQISEERQRPAPDMARVANLKKLKLSIKDSIERTRVKVA